MADDFVSKSLASAKKALADADKSNVAPKQSPYAPKPEHQYSDASYSMAHQKTAPSVGDELKAKSDNVAQYASQKE